ncbi:MAG: alpha/beta fold hydrolase [Pseudomonadota bacterium]
MLVVSASGSQSLQLGQEACHFTREAPADVTCGRISVPENWERSSDRTYELPFLRIAPGTDNPSGPPIVFLPGGPGEDAGLGTWDQALYWRGLAQAIFQRRELIILDVRGSGKSVPRLDCPRLNDPEVFFGLTATGRLGEVPKRTQEEAWKECVELLRGQGVDLSSVNRHQIARDVNALARALGLERIGLFGISYGTTYAMTVMRMYPDLVSDVVLDSVYPPETTADLKHSLLLGRVVGNFAAACSRDEACSVDFPNLQETFMKALWKFFHTPKTLKIPLPDRIEDLSVTVDAVNFAHGLWSSMVWHGDVLWVPHMLETATYEEPKTLTTMITSAVQYGSYKYAAAGASLLSACYDLPQRKASFPKGSLVTDEQLLMHADWVGGFYDACDSLPGDRAGPESRTPVRSDIPTLLLAGALDPATPPYQAQTAARHLKHGYLFVFPYGTHSMSTYHACARELIWDFSADPGRRPHRSCLDRKTLKPFKILR